MNIILSDQGDIMIFDSVGELEMQLEPIDVAKGSYVAYDTDGNLLQLSVENREIRTRILFLAWKSHHDYVTVHYPSVVENRSEELRGILVKYLSKVGMPKEELSGNSLEYLVSRLRAMQKHR